MQFLRTVLVALTAAAGLLAALRQNNLTSLASAVEENAEALLPALAGMGNKTVLAPSNAGFAALGDDVDESTLIATIAYHVLNGTYNVEDIDAGNHTIASTALNMTQYVNLPGDRSQVVVLSKAEGNNTAFVYQAGRNVSFAAAADGPTYQSILVQPIDQVLTIPGITSQIAGQIGVSQLATLLQSANLIQALDASTVTVFAPNNAAIAAVQDTIMAATPEQQTAVLLNHVVNNTVVYSTGIGSGVEATSASGNMLQVMANSTGAYVMSGNITARIVRSDYVAANGDIHVIDQVLVNTTNHPEAAESAAATQTSQPGVGTDGNEDSGSGDADMNGAFSTAKVGGGAAVMAMLASGMWLLA